MPRNQNQVKNQCQDHSFLLKPITNKKCFNRKMSVSFCKQINKNQKNQKNQKNANQEIADSGCSLFPIFNKDKNFGTPCFILPNQKEYFIENRKFYQKDHERKVREYQQPTSELYLPEPSSTQSHCNVCCQSYQNYFQHINSQKHHQQIKQSRFNRSILQLQQKLSPNIQSPLSYKRSYNERVVEIIQISLGQQNLHNENYKTGSFNQIQVLEIAPRKKIKLQNNQNYMYQRPILQTYNGNRFFQYNSQNRQTQNIGMGDLWSYFQVQNGIDCHYHNMEMYTGYTRTGVNANHINYQEPFLFNLFANQRTERSSFSSQYVHQTSERQLQNQPQTQQGIQTLNEPNPYYGHYQLYQNLLHNVDQNKFYEFQPYHQLTSPFSSMNMTIDQNDNFNFNAQPNIQMPMTNYQYKYQQPFYQVYYVNVNPYAFVM